MESIQPFSDHPLGIDASYFNGFNKEGNYLGLGMQRRPKLRAECVFFLRLPQLGLDLLEWPFSPSCHVKLIDNEHWSTDTGLNFEMLKPMKQWKVWFEGNLKERRTGVIRKVKFDFLWNAESPYFDMDTDQDVIALCEAVSTEEWSRDFFDRLHKAHQSHYEVFGTLKGKVSVEGFDDLPLTLASMKDRSYGIYRNWSEFHRYILQYFATDKGLYFACHLISFPVVMSHVVMGFVMDSTGKKVPIRYCSKKLYEIGEDGTIPDHFEYVVTTGDGAKYDIKVQVVDKHHFQCGHDFGANNNSVLSKIWINGDPGQGLCEFEYRNKSACE